MTFRPAPKPTPRLKPTKFGRYAREKRPNEKRDKEQELEALVRKLVFWRDGHVCICAATDGRNCSGDLQWSHYFDRAQSGWFTLTLVSFMGCSNHNKLNDSDKSIMRRAVRLLLGEEWQRHIEVERMAHRTNKVWMPDLEERLERYGRLWENKPSLHTRKLLLRLGYYDA